MAKTYAQMKSNVAVFIQDTSSDFSSFIATAINNKYKDVSLRNLWSSLITFDYTFNTAVGTAQYDQPADFQEELFVANVTDGIALKRIDEPSWWAKNYSRYSSGVLQNGSPDSYVILESTSKILLDAPPDKIMTIAMPYMKSISELTADSDVCEIKDIEVAIEFGAIGECLAYKKQYQKADYFLSRYEFELNKRIGQEKTKINQLRQQIPGVDNSGRIFRFTGDVPYA